MKGIDTKFDYDIAGDIDKAKRDFDYEPKVTLAHYFVYILFQLIVFHTFGQRLSLKEIESDLHNEYSQIFPFYYGDRDSLEIHSKMFTKKIAAYINEYPSTLQYNFKVLKDSNDCSIVTSTDGLFRVYSWDTWLGGTMHAFNNIFQYKSADKIYSTNLSFNDDEDIGGYYTSIFTLKANNKTYYLAIYGGSESTKDAYEIIKIYTIEGASLNDNVALIKTPKGFTNSISFEYDFFSVVDRPERPIILIKYDSERKVIYIPIVLENGKVTNRFLQYQFNGKYFEYISSKKKFQ